MQKVQEELVFDELLALARREQYGAILRYYRQKAGWKAWQLAELYGEATRTNDDDTIDVSHILKMETKNMVPKDRKRRWILARILDIPLVLLGLEAMPNMGQLLSFTKIDRDEYETALKRYTQGWHDRSAFSALMDIKERITNLHNELPYADDRLHLVALTCGYHLVAADIAHDNLDHQTAVGLLQKAKILAESEPGLDDVQIFILRQLVGVCMEHAEIAGEGEGYTRALEYNAQAQLLRPRVHPFFQSQFDMESAIIKASAAKSPNDLARALKTLDLARIGARPDETSVPVIAILDQERMLLNQAWAHLQYPLHTKATATQALESLENAERVGIGSPSRNAFKATLEARAWFQSGELEAATAYTEAAIDQVGDSKINLARLDGIYQQLRKTSFGKSPDVAHLGVRLLKAQNPGMFA